MARTTPKSLSIFEPRFESELHAYTSTLLKKISTSFNLDFAELVNTCLEETPKQCKKEGYKELELIVLNNTYYLYDSFSCQVYTYSKKPILIGNLNEDMELVPMMKKKL